MALNEFSRDKLIKINSVSVIDSKALKTKVGQQCSKASTKMEDYSEYIYACKIGPF